MLSTLGECVRKGLWGFGDEPGHSSRNEDHPDERTK